MTDQREAVARIIDPEAFRTLREIAAEAGLDAAKPPPGVILLDPIDGPRKAMQPRCDEALAKADAIISTLGSQAVEPEREGDLRERLCLLFETATLDRDPHTNLNTGTSAEQMADLVLATLPALPIRREVTPEREAIARVLWFDFVDQQGYPNGLPTWDEMAAWPTTDRNNRCDEYLSYADVIRAHYPCALASAPKVSDGESGRG